MHLALRPYVTTGVALVGASVIAAAPMQPVVPADIQIANPAVQAVERGVQLTANEIQTAVNNAIFAFVARPTVAGAELLGRLLEPILGEEQAALLPIAALGFAGPLISGGGSVGTALQEIVDSEGFEGLLLNLIGALGTITDGSVNGGYGPDLVSLVAPILFPSLPEALWPEVLSGGFISEQITEGMMIPTFPYFLPTFIQLPGTIPTLQGLIESLLGGEEMASASVMAAPVEEDRPIEEGVNSLVYGATAVTLRLVTLAAPFVAPILGVSNEEAAGFLALGTLGLIGPLINGTNGFGHTIQDLVDSDDFAAFLDNSLDLVRLPIDGAVNGGFSPNFAPLVSGYLPPIPPVQVNPTPPPNVNVQPTYGTILAGGFYPQGQTVNVIPNPNPMLPPTITVDVQLPGTIPTLQGLVTRVFGSNETNTLKTAGDNVKLAGVTDVEKDSLKRNRPLLNIVRHSLGADSDGVKAGAESATTGRHRIGTPVRDLINKVVNGGRDNGDDDNGGEDNDKPAAE